MYCTCRTVAFMVAYLRVKISYIYIYIYHGYSGTAAWF